MADYWKSQPKKFCIYCKCWIADNKPSIDFHERGKNHKENVIKKISEIKQRSMAKVKEAEKQSKEFAAMEEAALKAYEEDLKRLEGTKPAPIAPVGPTIEERRARDEQKRKEIEAIEKHHAKKKWTKAYSSEGYPYYYNTLSGDTQWEAPDGFQDTEDKSEEQGAKPVWVEGVSEEGYTYYYNAETGESRWEKPEDFICGLPSKEDQESPTDKQEDTVAEEKADSVELKPETSSDESSQSEQATSAPSVTKTVKINFRSKKEKKTDKTPEVDSKEEDNEVKQDTKEDDSSKKQIPSQRPKKANPYGSWEEITQEEDPYDNVDLELPNMEYDEPQASVPDIPQEPKVYFKEKTITSLGDTVVGTSVFKKRKLENVKSRNIRQRLTDQ